MPFGLDAGLGDAGLDQILRVVAVENREIAPVTEQIGVLAQNPRADGMERAAPERRQLPAQQIGDAPHHFAGGLVGEREQQNSVRRDALFQQIGDAIGERARLAGAGAGNDERRAGRRGDGGQLLRIQFARVINLQIDFGTERFKHVIARHGAELKGQTPARERKISTFRPGDARCPASREPATSTRRAVMPTHTGASNRSSGSEPRIGNRSCAERMSRLPGKEVWAMTCPPPVTACEMPELARRKIGMPYSAARTGATRA